MAAVTTGPAPMKMRVGRVVLEGDLAIPKGATRLVIFAHGSGSGRFSPRNRWVAERLNAAGIATLLFDLLTAAEEATDEASGGVLRFDIPLLAGRLVEVIDWIAANAATSHLRVGCFGASTGAAAALIAAAQRPEIVRAVVSRGGRPDLAQASLSQVQAPTLLIVGGYDEPVLELNREAAARMDGQAQLEVVPGATHLFEESGALDQVATLAVSWFRDHLSEAPR